MDDQYYRKENPEWRKPEGLFKKLWKKKAFKLGLIITLIILIIALFSNKGILQRMRLEKEKQVWQEKVKAAEDEQDKLQKELKGLENDKKTIEKVARERYGMVKEGETVYKLKKKEE